MIAATATYTLFHGRDGGLSLRPSAPTGGDSAPLTLLDILPDRHPTATEPLDRWRRLGEIKDGIIEDLTIRLEATE